MIKDFLKLIGVSKREKTFSGFFRTASKQEKEELLDEVVKKAQKDQRSIIEKHKQLYQEPQ